MQIRSYGVAAVADGGGGWNPVIITQDEAGDMRAIFGWHRVGATGLDGGTYAVAIKIPGDDVTWWTHATGVANNVLTEIDVPCDQIKITISGAGIAADPAIQMVSRPWREYRGR